MGGGGDVASFSGTFKVKPVPEPATALLLVLGLATLARVGTAPIAGPGCAEALRGSRSEGPESGSGSDSRSDRRGMGLEWSRRIVARLASGPSVWPRPNNSE